MQWKLNLSENIIAAGNVVTDSKMRNFTEKVFSNFTSLIQSVDKITQDKFYFCFRI